MIQLIHHDASQQKKKQFSSAAISTVGVPMTWGNVGSDSHWGYRRQEDPTAATKCGLVWKTVETLFQ